MPAKRYPPHLCAREGCGRTTTNKTYCSNECSILDRKARKLAKEHPCPICGAPAFEKTCGNPVCVSEFVRRKAHARTKDRMRVCSVCGQEKHISQFHRLSESGNYHHSRVCHECQPRNAYTPGQAEVPRALPKPKPVPVQKAWKDHDPMNPVLPIAVDEHGRRPAIPWSSLNLGGLPGTSTSATPFAA